MQLLDLPLVLVEDILELCVASAEYSDPFPLRLVNRLFNREIFKNICRHRLSAIPYKDHFEIKKSHTGAENVLTTIPHEFKLEILRTYLGDGDRGGTDAFQSHAHAVIDNLVARFAKLRPDQPRSRDAVLNDVCEATVRSGYHRRLFGYEHKWREKLVYDSRLTKTQPMCPKSRHMPFYPPLRREKSANPESVQDSVFVVAILLLYTDIVASMLLEQPARSNSTSMYFGRALDRAALFGHTNVVRQLLQAGAHTPDPNANYNPLLRKVACRGHVGVTEALIDPLYAEQCLASEREIGTAAEYGARFKNYDVVDSIISARPDALNSSGKRILYYASNQGNELWVQRMLDHGFARSVQSHTSPLYSTVMTPARFYEAHGQVWLRGTDRFG